MSSSAASRGKKFTLKTVLDGLRGSGGSSQNRQDTEIEETLRPEHYHVTKTVRHGFPFTPTALAFDPVQHLLAIGNRNGSLRIIGQPGVDCHCNHDSEVSITQILFLVNEGALVTVTSDDHLHLWNFRQKQPSIVHSLKFQREKISKCHLPFQSKWLYVGTERGNVHVVNIESFTCSGYIINWNKAIELSRKTHPGPVVHLSDNPVDSNKLLIGFESGAIVFWDLRTKSAEYRYNSQEALRSISWHNEGKQFMCSHTDGSLSTWNVKTPQRPVSITSPHAKIGPDGKPDLCKPITKVEWRCTKTGESIVIFSGGMSYDRAGRTPTITVMAGKSTTVLEMEHNVVDFVSLCDTPWVNDFQDPYAIVVLLLNDLVVIDLTTPGYPCFENPYPMDLHESPVTACQYYANCPMDIIPALYSTGKNQKKSGFSEKHWPIKGGSWGASGTSYPEIIITGHADGSLKFWDASSVTLQFLYKLKTAKVFEKPKRPSEDKDDDPFAIQNIFLCLESRIMCVAGPTHCILFKFSKQETSVETVALEFSIVYEIFDEPDSPEFDFSKPSLTVMGQHSSSMGSYSSTTSDNTKAEAITSVKAKSGSRRWGPGFLPDLVCILCWVDGEPAGNITVMSVNSSYGLLAFGNESGLAIVDYLQRTCLLNLGTPDLYGSMDPYQRAPRSPRSKKNTGENLMQGSEDCKSPTVDQINGDCLSPTTPGTKIARKQLSAETRRPKGQGTRKLQRVHSVASMDEPFSSGDKADASFSRSRSSSMSSLDNVTKEAIQCLVFADSFTRKQDNETSPCLWVGTSLGSVIVIVLVLQPDQRLSQPVIVSPSGSLYRMKGAIVCMSFLDFKGGLIPALSEQWRDNRDNREFTDRMSNKATSRQMSVSNSKPKISPTASTEMNNDRQFAILCSEKQARAISLPSQTCAFKTKVSENSFVVRAEVVNMRESVCLMCYVASGHIKAFSLPSLKMLLKADFLPLTDYRVARTFCFSNNGHAMFLCSPSEIQKITYSAEISDNLREMLGELFLPKDTPEPPKQGFLKTLFGGGVTTLDREELFGEASGKASKGLAKHIPGSGNLQHLSQQASASSSEFTRTRLLLSERGEKLGDLEDRSAQMMNSAEQFASAAHNVMLKCKDKKWYQF
ncbi:syntaxin-binding protein 5-like isoform X3 [Physella acuta]|uniref:syntaxin-binding protein 5-like isoform X3 n=1 Tax=Physella acuta TaxID=109671 RepID=UPI0027DCD9BC|nr:syntaxin-binding protein 5-like isoform X3 [Physella acuta]